jgi:hypothetical protein
MSKMENENNNYDIPESNTSGGVFNINEIDKFTIAKIENVKTNLLLNLTQLNQKSAIYQLKDLILTMEQLLQKYYPNELNTYTTTDINQKKKTFIDIVKASNEDFYNDSSIIRSSALNLSNIWNYFMSKLNVKLTTKKLTIKKK